MIFGIHSNTNPHFTSRLLKNAYFVKSHVNELYVNEFYELFHPLSKLLINKINLFTLY